MADITNIAIFIGKTTKNIDISASGNVTKPYDLEIQNELSFNGGSEVLDAAKLDTLLDGSDASSLHDHDSIYFTETELSSDTSGSSGATLIKGDNKAYTNIAGLSTYTIQDFLDRINIALSSAGGTEFDDATFKIIDSDGDDFGILFDVSASTADRTITTPDANVDLGEVNTSIQQDGSRAFTANQPMGTNKLTGLSAGSSAGDSVRYEQVILANGSNDFSAAQSMGGFKLTNVADPTANQDAATKAYVDAVSAGLKPKAAVRAASTGDVDIATELEDGDSLDGVTLATGDRVLLKDQAAAEENGIYIVAASGAADRSEDFDSLTPIDEINGAWVAVQEGTVNEGRTFVQTGTVATLDTDDINFTYWDPTAGITGGDMITNTGGDLSVDLATDAGLESSNPGNAAGQLRVKPDVTGGANLASVLNRSANGLAIKIDDSSIGENGSAQLEVKDDGISSAKIADDAVIEAKIADNAVTENKIADDAVTTDKIANANVTEAKIADDAVTTDKIADNAVTADKINSDVAGYGIEQQADGSLAARGTYIEATNNSGSTIAAASMVRISAAGEFELAQADALANTEGLVGVLLAETLDAAIGQIQIIGEATVVVAGGGNLTAGGQVWLSKATAGAVTQSNVTTEETVSGNTIAPIGVAIGTSAIVINIGQIIEVE